MSKLVRNWGKSVSADDLGCALAEAGLGPDGVWRTAVAAEALAGKGASKVRELAAAWRNGRGSGAPHIAIEKLDEDAVWLTDRLSRALSVRGGVHIRHDEPTSSGWEWPLTVGLPSGPASREFSERFADWPSEAAEIRIIELEETTEAVDLLLLPFDLADALAVTTARSVPLRAGCVVVLGAAPRSATRTTAHLESLRSSVGAAGVALVSLPERPDDWLTWTIEALSQGAPIDSALLYASRKADIKAPVLIASTPFVEFSRPESRVRRMQSPLETVIETSPMPAPPAAPAARPRPTARAKPPMHSAEPPAEAAGAAASAPAAAAPEARFIQAQVFAPPGTEPARMFQAGVEHRIDVRIGQADALWLGPGAAHAFPDHELPAEHDEHELRIVLVEPALLAEPLSGTVTLPRRGSSSTCSFALKVPAGTKRVDARLIVTFGNRVLQTALLVGEIGGPIALTVEAVVRPVPGGLDERRQFDAAVVLHRNQAGAQTLTKLATGNVAFSTPGDLEAEIAWFDHQLTDVARNRADFTGGLGSPATVDLLRSFALHGSILFEYLVTDTLGDDALAKGERLQIVATHPEARLPVEFVYDRKAPDADAPLCPNAAEALARGSCDPSCPQGAAGRSVVCPLGFWGVSRVIERHAHDPKTSRALGGNDFAFQAEPVGTRQTVSVLQGAQIAASQRVEATVPGGLERLLSAAGPVMQTPAIAVRTWDDWADKLGAGGRSLLVLLVHTDTGPGDTMPQMEIGKESWLLSARIDERYVRPTVDGPPPVVLLIGCETAAPEVSFAGLASQFRRHGAAIVVSTGSKIHSDQAVPIAASLITELGEIDERAEGCFGEVMRGIRRRLLAEGHVMVLTLTAFGDADWRLAP